jgi:hypothetical protein
MMVPARACDDFRAVGSGAPGDVYHINCDHPPRPGPFDPPAPFILYKMGSKGGGFYPRHLLALLLPSSSSSRPLSLRPFASATSALVFHPASLMSKAQYLEALPWGWLNMDAHTLQGLVAGGQLTANTDPSRPTWIILPARHQEPQPPEGYMVSFTRLHKQGFNAPASRFM